MTPNADRIARDIEQLAAFTETPGAGASRPTFTAKWRQAVDYVAAELGAAGCTVRTDAAGNLRARPAALGWDAPVWLSGSHLDTVPNGGNFDGVAGVVIPLEVLRAAHEAGRDDLPLELIVFAEEEGPTFGLGMLGSRTLTGALTAADLAAFVNRDGQTFIEAGRPHGVRPDAFESERLRPQSVRGLVEVHIEQGIRMWRDDVRLSVVRAIAGRRQGRITVRGRANHAGSTAMSDRADALAGAAQMIVEIEQLAADLSPDAVATVGRIECRPNAINVIADHVTFTFDLRDPSDDVLSTGRERIDQLVAAIAQRRGLTAEVVETERQPAVAMDADLVAKLGAVAAEAGLGALQTAVSGALHDAAILAPHVPTAMLFVPSRDGVSHHPDEFSRTEDLHLAARLLSALVDQP